jgi:excisionase family DNA binding protein
MQPENEHNYEYENNLKLMRAKDISSILNISRSYAYLLMQSGELPTVRLGRSIRVRPQDLEVFIERNIHHNIEVAR